MLMVKHWSLLLILLGCIGLTSCAIWRTPTIARIALLAPFEGRYREIGYSALYPARLALAEAQSPQLELLAVDDGGSIQTARDRARALVLDETVKAVIVIGYDATDPETQRAFADLPVLVIGEWLAPPISERVFMLTHPDIRQSLSYTARLDLIDAVAVQAPFIGGEIFGLEGFQKLRPQADGIEILSSGALPDAQWTAQILASDTFATAPNHLAIVVYDAIGLLAHVIPSADISREAVVQALRVVDYMGRGGRIVFDEAGYWSSAPIYRYRYQDGVLIVND